MMKCPHCGKEINENPTRDPYFYDGRLKNHLEDILRLLQQKILPHKITKQLGLFSTDNALIEYIRRRYGIDPPERSTREQYFLRNKKILADYETGRKVAEIARELGIYPARVYQIIHKEERMRRRAAQGLCVECEIYPADPPSNLCPGCQAYKEHTGF